MLSIVGPCCDYCSTFHVFVFWIVSKCGEGSILFAKYPMIHTKETILSLTIRTWSPSMMTQVESRSLNSSNSKDSSGGQPLSEHIDSKGK